MIPFLKKLTLFFLPAALVFAFPFFVLFYSGEFASVSRIGSISRSASVMLVGPAYSYFRQEFQHREAQVRKPEVLAIGNSRVAEFRSLFFKDPSVFFNAGGAAGSLSDYRYFLESLPKEPKILIANMDHGIFNPEQAKNNVVERPNPFGKPSAVYDPFFESFFRQGGWWKAYADIYRRKYTLGQVTHPGLAEAEVLGLRARAHQNGFTNDGSDFYGDVIYSPARQKQIPGEISALAKKVQDGELQEYGSGISEDALVELRKLLALCRDKNIFVIGFLPPIAHEAYAQMKAHPDAPYAQTLTALPKVLAGTYKEYGFDFYDFSDIESFGSSDAEMVEGKHGGEKMYLRMFIQMAKHSPALRAMADVPLLSKRLAEATSTYYVFGLGK